MMQDICNDPKCGCNSFITESTHVIDLSSIYSGLYVYITPTNSGKYSARGKVGKTMTDQIAISPYPLDALQKFLENFNLARDHNISARHDRP